MFTLSIDTTTPIAASTPCCQHDKAEGFPNETTRYSTKRCMFIKGHDGRHFNDDEYWG